MIQYNEGDVIGVPKLSPLSQNPVIFLNTATGVGATRNTWATIDLTDIVPSGTKAVRLDGILIISHGSATEMADLMVHFRLPSETYDYGYIMQTIETASGGGQRSNAGTWVSLDENLCFQYKWNTQSIGVYPTYSSYGINLTLTAYLRNKNVNLESLSADVIDILARLDALETMPQSKDQRMTGLIDYVKTL